MVRHIAVFRWKEGTSAEAIAEAKRRLDELPGLIAEIRRFACGPDIGGADGHWDFAVAADFEPVVMVRQARIAEAARVQDAADDAGPLWE